MIYEGAEVWVLTYRQVATVVEVLGDEVLVCLRNGNKVWVGRSELA